MARIIATLGDTKSTKHLYEVEVRIDGQRDKFIEVHANNRDQASRIAEKAGYEVCSVNMVG